MTTPTIQKTTFIVLAALVGRGRREQPLLYSPLTVCYLPYDVPITTINLKPYRFQTGMRKLRHAQIREWITNTLLLGT